VIDEPFYAYWLKATNKNDDPGFSDTLAVHEAHWPNVVQQILAAPVGDATVSYQKHMAIHMLPEVDLGWMSDPDFVHCFLIRDPREVIASMTEFRNLEHVLQSRGPQAAAELVGIPQLQRIYDRVTESGAVPPVLDANSVLSQPTAVLAAFCERVGLPFEASKELCWSEGQHPTDGAWAPFWYQKVFATTTLKPYTPKPAKVPAELLPVVDACMPTYERLYALSLRPNQTKR
jgi:hypothetical protein